MDLLQFISTMTTALAWPVVACFVVLLFRKGIIERLPDLSKATLPGGISVEFNKALLEVATEAPRLLEAGVQEAANATEVSDAEVTRVREPESLPPARPNGDVPVATEARVQLDLLAFSVSASGIANDDSTAMRANPNGVVMESWERLKSAFISWAEPPSATPGALSFEQLFALAKANGRLTMGEAEILRKLERLRNIAAHSTDALAVESVEGFKELATRMTTLYVSRTPARKKGVE
jgi:hypothetical protein